MGKLAKILAPIAAVLAIAMAVLSFLLLGGFKVYQKRANNLAETVTKSAKALDNGSGSGVGDAITFTASRPGAKEDGKLSFKEYQNDAAAFEKATGSVAKLAEDVTAQRNEMSESICAMLNELGVSPDSLTAEELNKLESYSGLLAFAKSYIAEYKKHDNEVVKAVKDTGKVLGAGNAITAAGKLPAVTKSAPAETSSEEGEDESEAPAAVELKAAYTSQEKALAQLKGNAEALQKRKMAYEAAIKGMQRGLTAYKLKANVNSISGNGYEKVLMELGQDLMAINAKLMEIDGLKRQLQQAQSEISSLKGQVSRLTQEKRELQAKLDEVSERLNKAGLGDKVTRKVLKHLDEVDAETKGTVLLDNPDWNYIICDLGNTKIVEGAQVTISADGEYIASGVVKKVQDEISLIEITRRKEKSIPENAVVYMGRNIVNP